MDPGSCKITVFSTPTSHYECSRSTFDLKVLLSLQKMITTFLGDLKVKIGFAYLDDIILASPDEDSHLAGLEAVLQETPSSGFQGQTL